MIDFLLETNKEVEGEGGELEEREQEKRRKRYRELLGEAGKEYPLPPPNPPGKRGRVPKSKTRNLIERLRDYEEDTLRFMTDKGI
ncbi:MAG: IS66 family transposase, partial [Treponema sp.]|nr:IS66 family transposase [Treponema sp.]